MYVCMYVFYYCTVAIVYALFCFHMGFIAFWTCLINLLTYLLTYLHLCVFKIHSIFNIEEHELQIAYRNVANNIVFFLVHV